MERENRYLVLKNEDISAALTADELTEIIRLEEKVNLYRSIRTKKPVECVVVEHDWPMYERVWGLIERWVDGNAPQIKIRKPSEEDKKLGYTFQYEDLKSIEKELENTSMTNIDDIDDILDLLSSNNLLIVEAV